MNHDPKIRIRPFRRAFLTVLLVIAAASPALRAADETTAKVDKIFASWDKTTSPGMALAVIKDGKIVYERGYGMAKLEDGIVNTPDKVFDIGSVSKQFTAACVAMLVRDGKVRVEDDIRKYLPEMPAYGKPVTVDHLLHHTSGIRDYNALLSLAGFRPESDSPDGRGGRRDHPAAEEAQLHAGRRVFLHQQRLLPAQPDRREGQREVAERLRPGAHLQAAGHDQDPLPGRSHPDHQGPGHGLHAGRGRGRLQDQHEQLGRDRRRQRLHDRAGPLPLGPGVLHRRARQGPDGHAPDDRASSTRARPSITPGGSSCAITRASRWSSTAGPGSDSERRSCASPSRSSRSSSWPISTRSTRRGWRSGWRTSISRGS